MKSSASFILASSLITIVAAQTYPVISPDDIQESIRQIWCDQQIGVCPNLCQDQLHVEPINNDCWIEDLHFECICEGGILPNLTEYSLTIPFNLCKLSVQKCADNCGNNQPCATDCFENKICGASDPRRTNRTKTRTSTTLLPTATGKNNNDKDNNDGSDDGEDSTDDNSDPVEEKDPFSMGAKLTAWGSVYGAGAMVLAMSVGFIGML